MPTKKKQTIKISKKEDAQCEAIARMIIDEALENVLFHPKLTEEGPIDLQCLTSLHLVELLSRIDKVLGIKQGQGAWELKFKEAAEG